MWWYVIIFQDSYQADAPEKSLFQKSIPKVLSNEVVTLFFQRRTKAHSSDGDGTVESLVIRRFTCWSSSSRTVIQWQMWNYDLPSPVTYKPDRKIFSSATRLQQLQL